MCGSNQTKQSIGCIIALFSLAVLPTLLINYAFSYYKMASGTLMDGRCFVHNSTLQEQDAYYGGYIGAYKEHRALFDVDFISGDVYFTHVAAIAGTWQGTKQALVLNNMHSRMEDK
jgi:hypothetical protein